MSQATDGEALVRRRVQENMAVQQALLADGQLVGLLARIAEDMTAALRAGRKILLFGNGGSAADAQHIAAEFVGRYRLERRGLPALALTVNTSSLTAIGNDYSFDLVFTRQLEALGSSGDVAVGISTSGNAANVVAAVETARRRGMLTVGFTGRSGGKLAMAADRCVRVPSDETPRIQESHILIGHILSEIVESALFGG